MITNPELVSLLYDNGYIDVIEDSDRGITLQRTMFDDGGIRYSLHLQLLETPACEIGGVLRFDGETYEKLCTSLGHVSIQPLPINSYDAPQVLNYVNQQERILEDYWFNGNTPYYWEAP